jgi:GNAT superfamily N-acetyltransferase
MSDEEFLRTFEECRFSAEEWTHEAHIRTACLYSKNNYFDEALTKIRNGIKRLNDVIGVRKRGYHESITVLYLTIIFERVSKFHSWNWLEFKNLNPDLFQPNFIYGYYTEEVLGTRRAAERFVLPDKNRHYSLGLLVSVRKADPESDEIFSLTDALSAKLESITGRDGRNSFATANVTVPKSAFLAAYLNEEAIGCGAIRPFDARTAEIKRMYSKVGGMGIGTKLLRALEGTAKDFGYEAVILETGIQNDRAISFYKKHGYFITENFGKYIGRSECVCMKKVL